MRTCEVLVLYFTILSTCEDYTSGWFRNSGSTPGLAPTLRDVTVLFFRLLLKKTVLSQSEGHLNLLNPRPRGGAPPSDLHRWFSGKINGCQWNEPSVRSVHCTQVPLAPGSIPGRCITYTQYVITQARCSGSPPLGFDPRLAMSTATLRRQHRIPSDLRS